jgi:hypothetical protein
MIEFAKPRPLWRPRPIALPGPALTVRWKTELCDRHGRVERVLQRGRNTITNWGMDQLASSSIYSLISTLVLSSTQDTRKRALSGGNNLTVTYTSPTNVTVVADANFFVSGDVGYTLALLNVPELKITAFTDPTHVTCQTPSGEWLPGFSVPGSPTVYSAATIYYTSNNQLATYFTQFSSFDTGGVTLTIDNSNSQHIHQRIFLSSTVSGADWTVNQLGWSDGNGSHNVFGVANLAGPDVIPIGKKYRVTLTVYSKFTPINLAGVAVNWGGTIGAYTMDIRQEYIGYPVVAGGRANWLEPHANSDSFATWSAKWWTTSHALVSTYWQGQSGGTAPNNFDDGSGQAVVLGSYTNGQYMRTKNVRWPDTVDLSGVTALGAGVGPPMITLRPTSGTVTKPSGFWCDATFKIFWTRDLTG